MEIFTLVGKMAIEGLDKSKQQLGDLEKKTQQVQKGLKVMGAAFTAVGAAGLALIQSTKKINAQLGVTALNLGVTTKEMRDLTLATTNVTFPIDEVTASFDLLARAGVKDMKILQDTATAFDTLGDATGMSASRVTSILVPAMKTFNLTATEMAGKTDLMTYMARESTMSLEDFGTMVGYTTPELVEQGLTLEELTVALIHMEKQGYAPGRVMTREFMKATTLAAKENISLSQALGITEDQMEDYTRDLEGAAGMTEEYAAVANEQFTIMDKMKQKWSELTLGASGFLEPLEPVLAGMTALGPLMIGLSTSAGTAAIKWGLHTVALVAHKVAMIATAIGIKAVTVAQWLWNAAMMANPIGLIIAAIVALIAIGVLLWKNWDKVTEFFEDAWDRMKAVMNTAKEFFINIWEKIVGIFTKHWDKILAILFPIPGLIILIARNWETIKEFFKATWEKIVGIFTEHWDKILAILFPMVGIPILIARNWGPIVEFFKELWEKVANIFTGWRDNIKEFITKMNPWEWMKEAWEKLQEGISGILSGIFGGSDVEEWVAGLNRYFGEQDFAPAGEQMLNTFKEGVAKSLDETGALVKEKVGEIGEELGGVGPGEVPAEAGVEELLGKIVSWRHKGAWAELYPGIPYGLSYRELHEKYGFSIKELAALTVKYVAWIKENYPGYFPGGLEGGGIVMRPITARIAEKVPEAVIPLNRESLERLGFIGGGPAILITGNTFNVREEEDIDRIAEQLVDRIRLRTGAKI